MKYILAIVFVTGCFGQSVALNGSISLEGGTSLTPGGSPQVSLSQTSLTFSTQLVNQDATTHTNLTHPQAVTVTNNGTAPLGVSSVSIGGANAGDWYLFEDTCRGHSIAVGGYCMVYVSFDPQAPGSRVGTLSIADSAPGTPQTVALTGTATAGTVYYFSPNGNDSTGTGTLTNPWKNTSSHSGSQGAGVQFVLRGGRYQTTFSAASGTQAQPMVFKAYPGETPVIDSVPGGAGGIGTLTAPGFILDGIVFERAWVSDVLDIGGTPAVSGLIQNCVFRELGGQPIRMGVLGPVNGLTIQNNYFDTWGTPTAAGGSGGFNDGIVAAGQVSHILIRNNYATHVGHYFVDMGGYSSYWIDHDNTIESYGGGAFAEANRAVSFPGRFIQNNRIAHVGPGVIFSKTCFEIQSSFTVVRNNFCTDQSGNNDNQAYDTFAQWNGTYGDVIHSREYNNDYFNNGGYVWLNGQVTSSNSGGGQTYTLYNHLIDAKMANDIAFQNNQTYSIFNLGERTLTDYIIWNDGDHDSFFPWTTFTGSNQQLNSILGNDSSSTLIYGHSFTGSYTLAQAIANGGGNVAAGNLQANPSFASSGSALKPEGFELQAGSPAIAAGSHLTTTSAAGTNTNSVPVADPYWFTDGMGMMPGDLIKIAGNPAVRILQVNGPHSGNMLYSRPYGLRTNSCAGNTGTNYCGMQFTVSTPINVTAVGRMCFSGNSQTHLIGLGIWGQSTYLTNGSATVNMASCTAGTIVYASLPASITLSPGTTYWMLSGEVQSSDSWSDVLPIAVSAPDIFNVTNGVYSNTLASMTAYGGQNDQYVGLDLQYTSSLPSNTLIVGAPVTFSSGATVDLANYNGAAPDMGALPYSTTAPVISSVSESSTNATTASVTWSTTNPADSQCTVGLTSFYGVTSVRNSAPVTSHSCYLTGLWPNTTYHYAVISVDQNGGRSISADATFTTPAHPGPTVSNVYECGVNSAGTQATICWTTSTLATSQVLYSSPSDQPTDYHNASAVQDTTGVTTHSVTLTGLTANFAYHFSVQSTDVSTGATSYSPDSIFVTPWTATTGPTFSNITVAASDLLEGGGSGNCWGPWNSGAGYCGYSNAQATISWTASETVTNPKVGFIMTSVGQNAQSQYAPAPPSNYDEWATLDTNSMVNVQGNSPSTSASVSTTTPNMTIYRLEPNAAYYFYVQSTDASSVSNKSYRMMFTTPAMDIPSNPVIPPQTYLTETATSVTNNSATITWTMPSSATCQLEYGTSSSYGSTASGSSGTSCSVALTGLSSGTTYHVAVTPTNSAGMSFTGPDFTFTTP